MPPSEEDRQLANLDSTVIAIPLLNEMNEAPASKPLDVIVEINVVYSTSHKDTHDSVLKMIEKVSGAAAPEEDINEDEEDINEHQEQYVFRRLTVEQIRKLARENECPADERERSSSDEAQASFGTKRKCPIYKIWPDFEVEFQGHSAAATVKADAARISFAAAGQRIVWAVIDSGIDGKHPHFKKHSNLDLEEPLRHADFSGGRRRKYIEDRRKLEDPIGHGTHVAGAIAGELSDEFVGENVQAFVRSRNEMGDVTREDVDVSGIRGMAPECKLLSIKVCDSNGRIRASRVMAAIAYVRRLNGDSNMPRIHGVNISLGHEFDPEWFACGQSPLCAEVDRLVRSGTCVVVAAGNGGFGTVDTLAKGTMKAGLSNTLRDPANADLAITVGSTHRSMPHVYGVSYFSAKGPTGDGRLKPDLVAPGEKIMSCASSSVQKQLGGGFRYAEQSGTSMAAAHVSGCLAAFLSIRSEFIKRPERVKEIFLSTATDLGRERYFQGNGLIDLMRAIQSV